MAAENISPSIFGDIDLNVSLLDFSSKEQPTNKDSSSNTDPVIIYDVDYGERNSCTGGEHCITLDLSLGNRADNLFCADETPTPTRFIKNCDDVGLFEDLRHVNPFDEGFRRAVEQGTGQTSTTATMTVNNQPNDGDSLHTPQVLYALDATAGSDYCLGVSTRGEEENIDKQIATTSAESRAINATESLSTNPTTTASTLGQSVSSTQDSMAVQLIQPQVITWVIPSAQVQAITAATTGTDRTRSSNSTIPVQTVRPFLLPKPSNENATVSKHKMHSKSPALTPNITSVAQASPAPPHQHQHQQHEPSSASLTPTSQLPIKERLKAIVNNKNSNRLRGFAMSTTVVNTQPKSKSKVHRDEDCMERRRAAATRYRNKMRKEHEELKQKNSVLQMENKNLRQRVKELEQALLNKQNDITQHASVPVVEKGASNQIQIPPSSIHLVINVPKMILPAPTQMSHFQQPIAPVTYSLEKK